MARNTLQLTLLTAVNSLKTYTVLTAGTAPVCGMVYGTSLVRPPNSLQIQIRLFPNRMRKTHETRLLEVGFSQLLTISKRGILESNPERMLSIFFYFYVIHSFIYFLQCMYRH